MKETFGERRSPTHLLGPTPITPVLRQVLQDKQVQIRDRKLLILIATDGTPTDDKGRVDIDSFEDVLRNHRNPIERIPVTIIACTGLTLFVHTIFHTSSHCR